LSSSRNITGRTRVVAVLGYPVEHSLSPVMHNLEFERLGLDYVYVPAAIKPDNLETAVKGLVAAGVVGMNVTIPHKQAVIPLLDSISEDAKMVGAVNTIKVEDGKLNGFNTDIDGWVRDIQEDILLERSKVCIVGAGGAARAVAVGAIRAGASRLFLCGRNPDTLSGLAGVLKERLPDADIEWGRLDDADCRATVGNCDIVVNTTPVGMESTPGMPLPADWLNENQYYYDTIYNPAETELMRAAREEGCAVRGGLGMLAYQGAVAFEIWTGQEPDVDRMKSTLRRALS
jgi:shikimate dehydrogenase